MATASGAQEAHSWYDRRSVEPLRRQVRRRVEYEDPTASSVDVVADGHPNWVSHIRTLFQSVLTARHRCEFQSQETVRSRLDCDLQTVAGIPRVGSRPVLLKIGQAVTVRIEGCIARVEPVEQVRQLPEIG